MDREVLAPLNEWLLQYDKMLVRGCLLRETTTAHLPATESNLKHVTSRALLSRMQRAA